jgi:hypothetical protein
VRPPNEREATDTRRQQRAQRLAFAPLEGANDTGRLSDGEILALILEN